MSRSSSSARPRGRFETPLAGLLGIEHPVLQSGMRRVAGPELVAAVSAAGGLGILAGLQLGPDELRREIAAVRARTDRPFGVNLWLHAALQPPIAPETVSAERVAEVQQLLNGFRAELHVPPRSAPPAPTEDLLEAAFEVILEERVPVFSVGLGDPGPTRVERCHERGIKVIAMATNVADARRLEASGVDALVAQGSEAGGHRSTFVAGPRSEAAGVGTITLVPQVVDAVRVPVIAAGGIADGRGLCAALALGAQAVMLGTRFGATRESLWADAFKQRLVASSADETVLTDCYSGLYGRALANRFSRTYAAAGAPTLPPMLQTSAAQDIYAAAAAQGNAELFPIMAGQSCGLIHDLPSARDVLLAMMAEAEQVRL